MSDDDRIRDSSAGDVEIDRQILHAVRRHRYAEITIVVHDGAVVEIDEKKKTRFAKRGQ